jgi:hypothetical protein
MEQALPYDFEQASMLPETTEMLVQVICNTPQGIFVLCKILMIAVF